MPPKRKQQLHDKTTARAASSLRDKMLKTASQSLAEATPSSLNKRKHAASVSVAAPVPTRPIKKLKALNKTPSKTIAPPATSPSPPKPTPKSTLIPRGPRQTATLHHATPSLLLMTCDSSSTPSKVAELHFRAIPHSAIDWDNAAHISRINAWRNQIYGRAGIKARTVSAWHEDEELWFELYFQLSIAEARGRGFLLPGMKVVREAFNEFFSGRRLVVRGKGRVVEEIWTEPRALREANAFASKFARVCPQLKARLAACCFGKVGDVFMPVITVGMLETYRVMKREIARRGWKGESGYADGLEDWRWFFGNLPVEGEAESKAGEGDEVDMQKKEGDAIAALMSLAHSSPASHASPQPSLHCRLPTDQKNTTTPVTPHAIDQQTPELSHSTRTSFSQASDGPCVPSQYPVYNPHGPHDYINSIVRGPQRYHTAVKLSYHTYENKEDNKSKDKDMNMDVGALHHHRQDDWSVSE